MHQVGNQPKLYYDARSTKQQETLTAFWVTAGDMDDISVSGKQVLAKLWLNSTWSKLTEQKKIISNHHDLYLFLATSVVDVMKLLFVSVDGVWVTWHFIQKQKIPSLRHTKEVLAAYVKASPLSKLHLLPGLITRESELLRQEFRVLYSYGMRTPSRLIVDKLGNMTKELWPGDYIEGYVKVWP